MREPPFVVPLTGTSNFRDLGGYTTTDGKRVRRGMVFRSAALGGLTAADQSVVAGLGLRTVCDFRGRREREGAPTQVPGTAIVPLPIEPSVGASLRDLLHTKEASGEALQTVLEQAYRAYALTCTMQYRAMLDRVLAGGTPLLFHCTAGKDRTGFGAALLLTALGVPWEQVVADFEATNQLWRRDTLPGAGLPLVIRESLLRADPALLAAAFDAVRSEYGAVDRYLEHAIGLGRERLAQLRAILLEEADEQNGRIAAS